MKRESPPSKWNVRWRGSNREGVRELGSIPPECDKFSPEFGDICVRCGKYLEDVHIDDIVILEDADGNCHRVCSNKCYREVKEFKIFE